MYTLPPSSRLGVVSTIGVKTPGRFEGLRNRVLTLIEQEAKDRAAAGWAARRGRVNSSTPRGRSRSNPVRVAEWQTRYLEVLVPARAWGFKSPLGHPSAVPLPAETPFEHHVNRARDTPVILQ